MVKFNTIYTTQSYQNKLAPQQKSTKQDPQCTSLPQNIQFREYTDEFIIFSWHADVSGLVKHESPWHWSQKAKLIRLTFLLTRYSTVTQTTLGFSRSPTVRLTKILISSTVKKGLILKSSLDHFVVTIWSLISQTVVWRSRHNNVYPCEITSLAEDYLRRATNKLKGERHLSRPMKNGFRDVMLRPLCSFFLFTGANAGG